MSKYVPSTDNAKGRKVLGYVYREAARVIESGGACGYCCFAINGVLGIKDNFCERSEAYKRFRAVFGPKKEPSALGWWGVTDSSDNERVIALCFMAAMVEAGDA